MTPAEHVRRRAGPRGEARAEHPAGARLGDGHGLARGDEQPLATTSSTRRARRGCRARRRGARASRSSSASAAHASSGRGPDGDLQLGRPGRRSPRAGGPRRPGRARRAPPRPATPGPRRRRSTRSAGAPARASSAAEGRLAAGPPPTSGPSSQGGPGQHDHDRAVVHQAPPRARSRRAAGPAPPPGASPASRAPAAATSAGCRRPRAPRLHHRQRLGVEAPAAGRWPRATASIVRSSWVGPRPPVAHSRSTPPPQRRADRAHHRVQVVADDLDPLHRARRADPAIARSGRRCAPGSRPAGSRRR